MSLPRIIVPTAIITVEVTTPTKSWKLPVADVLPSSIALSMLSPLWISLSYIIAVEEA